MPQIVAELVKRKHFVYLCTNALLLEKKIDLFKPSQYLTFSIHLDGLEEHHDRAVNQKGVFKRAVKAIELARDRGFRVNVNCTLFNTAEAEEVGEFLDFARDLCLETGPLSPGYAYERAPDQDHFVHSRKTTERFRADFCRGTGRPLPFPQSSSFLGTLPRHPASQVP